MMEKALYNAAADLIDRNLTADRRDKVAFIDTNGSYTYSNLSERVNKVANALTMRGLEPEQRIVLCMLDTIDLVAAFLGAIKAGIVPIPINTRLTEDDYAYIIEDSGAAGLILSELLLPAFEKNIASWASLKTILVSGSANHGHELFSDAIHAASSNFPV